MKHQYGTKSGLPGIPRGGSNTSIKSAGVDSTRAVADVDVESLAARGASYQAAPPGTRILYVNEQTESSSSFVVCSETFQRRTFNLSHVMSMMVILLMACFVLAVAYTRSSTVGCSGLDCLFESTGIVAQSINTVNTTTPVISSTAAGQVLPSLSLSSA